MKKSINEVLVLQKVVRDRISSLTTLRNTNSLEERRYFGNAETKVTTPQYNPKTVDKKITELQKFLFESDAKIKASNAVTEVDVEVNVDSLLASIE